MEKSITDIAKILVEKVKPQKIVLFGSHANGTNNQNSDIDLCLIDNRQGPKEEKIMEMRRITKKYLLPIDFLVFNASEFERRKDIYGTIQYEINKNGIKLYELE